MTKTLMTTSEVARMFNLGPDRIRDMDDVLRPARTTGGVRLYDPTIVERALRNRKRK